MGIFIALATLTSVFVFQNIGESISREHGKNWALWCLILQSAFCAGVLSEISSDEFNKTECFIFFVVVMLTSGIIGTVKCTNPAKGYGAGSRTTSSNSKK